MSSSPAVARPKGFIPRRFACYLQNIALSMLEHTMRLRVRECPCCGWSGLHFRSFAVAEYIRNDVICPSCGSFERHRALFFFYSGFLGMLSSHPSHILHFAPERCLESLLRSLCDRYEKSALGEGVTELQLDLTNLKLPDAYCDVILLNHVLDCMAEDRSAVSEMYRVLRPGGTVLAIVGLKPGSYTCELPVASNARHRVYGSEDLAERFAPFTVSVVNAAEGLDPAQRRRSGIPEKVALLVLRKRNLGGHREQRQ